ncbi:PD-(D/E)XK nuclease family protein [Treponema primitia]|uniref:PD-(D/E)XK nuclease family protein n=1 Tax=Treponema primitia TaxID=88058 RepID=UPI00397EDAB2
MESPYKNLFILYNSLCTKQIQQIFKLVNNISPQAEIKTEIDLSINEDFNIFTSFSDLYRKENFHSEILTKILDPHTNTIGNIDILKRFVTYLCVINNKIDISILNLDEIESIKLTSEEPTENGRIDIFIKIGLNCIIIENKLNNAPNMPNQLARYIEYAKQKNYNTVAIVYLPLYYKTPPFNYSKKYEIYTNEIKQKLVILPAKEFSENILDTVSKTANNETAKVYINHYSNLLKQLGGNSMTNEIDKEVLKGIFSNRENLTAAKNISDIYGRRKLLIGEIITEDICSILSYEKVDNSHYLKILTNNISIVFESNGLFFCVSCKNQDKDKYTGEIYDILIRASKLQYFKVGSHWEYPEGNFGQTLLFLLDDCNESIEVIKTIITDMHNYIETELKKI